MDKRKTAIAVCAVLFLAVVLLTAVLTDGSVVPNKDIGGRYAYTMTTNGKNVSIRIKGPFEEGYHWVCNKTEQTSLKLVSQEQNARSAGFVITTDELSVETAVFSLQNDTMPEDVIYKILVGINSDPEGNVKVVSSAHSENEKLERFASGSDMSYIITAGEAGEAIVLVDVVSASDCRVITDTQAPIVVNSEVKGAEQIEVNIKSLGEGEAPVYICSDKCGTAIFLDVFTSSLGYAEILDHEIVPVSEAVIETYIYSETDITDWIASDADISGGDIE